MFDKISYLYLLIGLSANSWSSVTHVDILPADHFDVSHWKLTLPLDKDKNGKIDEIEGVAMYYLSHPDYFFLDKNKQLVFQVPNKAITTSGSSNARSELRQMLRGTNTDINVKAPLNNFSLAAHPAAKIYGAIGGTLEATVKVEHVSLHAKHPEKYPAFSVVVGQVHANKDPVMIQDKTGFGYGNEPIKIFYKKWPNHETGSVFWTYERNLAENDPNRVDIAYPVWGNTWEITQDPQDSGIGLGDEFSYNINIIGNVMHLLFTAPNHKDIIYQIDLSNNVDANGKVDEKDNPKGYSEDSFYFKAGAYGQCSVKNDAGFWSTGCAGTGDFIVDKANGDYNRVSFSKLQLSK
ncbi:polysaccharide lyase family 7 protein [Cronobacter sakazakii]|uniref:polysaccharide lyase family 7 protein n=1 Tax=Cronobacter sakazakii TaxID=28141 RepID=UPI000BE7DD17|nr:polysaccharide lyase family 7 protein [Cronobacter sakazakii]PUV36143.1 polysaccharide lyase family 7 protein [Cronobacter sakazakii]